MPVPPPEGRERSLALPWARSDRVVPRVVVQPVERFLHTEAASGIVLVLAALVAVVWANSGWAASYEQLWSTSFDVSIGSFGFHEHLRHVVNDVAMVLFFFVVGLEIKRELVVGELNDRSKAAMPVIAALGGVVLPALIFVLINLGSSSTLDGWAIPMATDIAFAVAVLAILGSRIPSGVRLLLLSIAIVDDIIAITVIALFYTEGIDLAWLGLGFGAIALIVAMRSLGVVRIVPYVVVGVVVWLGFFESGIHATIAGVILGLLTPARPIKGRHVLEQLEHSLHPYSALLIVPLFALANAGIPLSGPVLADAVASSLFWGIVLGLVLGKAFGISLAIFGAERFGLAKTPMDVLPAHVWGIAALGGIGFTVSLFISQLAYERPDVIEIAKIGIFTGSLISAAIGVLLLRRRS